MPATGPEPGRISQYTMGIECPRCGAKMILNVGLKGDPKNDGLECIACQSEIESIVPGQVVSGPFPA